MAGELQRQLRGDEGARAHPYKDHLGYLTIGIGRCIDPRKGIGLRPDEQQFLLMNDIRDRVVALSNRLPWFVRLDEARQGVLINMAFQLGTDGLLGFKKTLHLVEAGAYAAAAAEMMDSDWAVQTPERAARLSKQMQTGVWQYAPGA